MRERAARHCAFACLLALGCGDREADGYRPPTLYDLPSAPAAIQRAAEAIVRIRVAQGAGTGSFISPDGLLLTNNHVLGNRICPLEGCWFELTFDHQRGKPDSDPRIVFGVPRHVDAGLDTAILQVYSGAPGRPGDELATPQHLTLRSLEPAELLGQHITIVGHPRARLKKWSDGVVLDASGAWFESTAFILPGDSGSPVLDDEGSVIGLIHRAADDASQVTRAGYLSSSYGTASAPLLAAMAAPLPASMLSVQADARAEDVVANAGVYLNAHAQTVPVAGVATSVLSLLAQACDEGLARADYASPEDLSEALTPCEDARDWIECRSDVAPTPAGVLCPETDLSAWAQRFRAMNQKQRELNGRLLYSPLSFGIAQLSRSDGAGRAAGAISLQDAIREAQPVLDFELAFYLAAFDIASYANTPVAPFVMGYGRVPHYQRYADIIALSALWLAGDGRVRGPDVLKLLARLARDANVDLGAKLAIEEYRYQAGEL